MAMMMHLPLECAAVVVRAKGDDDDDDGGDDEIIVVYTDDHTVFATQPNKTEARP